MSANNLMGPQIKRLLAGLAVHGNQHLTEIETDLLQNNFLLDQAITKLGASFLAMHEAVQTQQGAVSHLVAGGEPTPEIAAQLQQLAVQIDQHVNAAVTGLQFQDMTHQLISRTLRRVVGLRCVMDMLGEGAVQLPLDGTFDEAMAALRSINRTLDAESTRLESDLWKAVSQTHMESGDIELF